ncbi:chemotaxis protein CheW [Clostridium beijerinckii]|uniref:Chemotaxis protein CheW n=2 Tax=Clostridium TaxID=1485 RepID=A0A1S8S830_CLOBE|nr:MULTISPECIES: chemotaxis protein CheW [Clostridium]MBN7576098.1 purine-binding chemotaxis protein CheW [Clostridium beijerinckii]MBN7581397.1 purine-binding chemotaxis protein CheW [Clostridium beijerinckii]MBN7585870.1 purine-binding chemotaxis protein CheW [Clostridium beijerinckii]MBO0521752.1 purine-binding chemotaxis protein CheW [Clostridium beijerinckii]NMF05902.1 purine-binding chemotaxis protein CheW [Clostridium beijerinckii]
MSDLLDVTIENQEDTQKDKYLIFSIGQECYGIDIKYVIEIIGVEPITEVPELPKYIKGVINLRGKIIPVMDVRIKLKKEEKEYDDRTCIIVVEIENIDIGLIIDKVIEVANIDESNISPPPKVNLERYNSNSYIKGIGKIQNEVRLLIDCNRLLEDDEIEELNKGEV